MSNPNGPYPGRQLFVGTTVDGCPSLAYLVTGRSPQSRERKGMPIENGISMGPIGDEPYDWLRHYTTIKYDNSTGLAVVSNGIQTEAIFETYRLLFHTGSPPEKSYMEKIMDGARYEPDSYRTPRIAGVITNHSGEAKPVYIIGIITHYGPAKAFQMETEPGTMVGISTYSGAMDKPEPFAPDSDLPELKFEGKTAQELAEYLFNLSHALYQGDDIRVCSVGGIWQEKNHAWSLAIVNTHQTQG